MKLPSDLLAEGWCQGKMSILQPNGTMAYCHFGAMNRAFEDDWRLTRSMYKTALHQVFAERYMYTDPQFINDDIYPRGPEGQAMAVVDAQEAERRAGLRSD